MKGVTESTSPSNRRLSYVSVHTLVRTHIATSAGFTAPALAQASRNTHMIETQARVHYNTTPDVCHQKREVQAKTHGNSVLSCEYKSHSLPAHPMLQVLHVNRFCCEIGRMISLGGETVWTEPWQATLVDAQTVPCPRIADLDTSKCACLMQAS